MKRRDKEALRALSVAELESELKKRREELFKLNFGKVFGVPKNPLRARHLRRDIARLHTWIHEKAKEDSVGVN